MRHTLLVFLLSFFALPSVAQDAKREGIRFSHGDWEIACDNTGACAAAGYNKEGDSFTRSISVLLSRAAGAAQPVVARLQVADDEKEEMPKSLRLRINGKDYGSLPNYEDGIADLSAVQRDALLKSLRRESEILAIANDGRQWMLSDVGAVAVLLKMDDYQRRIGTVGALIRKGSKDESGVLPALPKPVIRMPALPVTSEKDRLIAKDPALLEALRSTAEVDKYGGSECERIMPPEQPEVEVVRLTDKKMLASAWCWLAAYNGGSGFWIINEKPPYQPEVVTFESEVFEGGVLSASFKGRGLGDCWSRTEYTWNGKAFVLSLETDTGMCRGFTGGAWGFSTTVSDVKREQ